METSEKGQFLPLEVEKLKKWFLENRRDLPWRKSPSPYGVWISEVMLQQTQVAVVKDYYERWMKRFPSVEALAKAPLDEVIKMWEGLGYYSRARNLHAGAKYLMEKHQGQLPSTFEELKKVKGIGPYTIGAILSFAFQKKAAAVDGNVLRVLSRYLAMEEEITLPSTQKKIWQYAEAILPEKEPWIVTEALIELGALVCAKEPKCTQCPLQKKCRGLFLSIADQLPIKGKKEKATRLHRNVLVITCREKILLKRGKRGEVMADLYEFPYYEAQKEKRWLDLPLIFKKKLEKVMHTFTRYRVTLESQVFELQEEVEVPGYEWVLVSKIDQLPFSSGHRRVLRLFQIV